MRVFLVFVVLLAACQEASPTTSAGQMSLAKPVDGEFRPEVCQCSPEHPQETGTIDCSASDDIDGDCVCSHEDNCPGTPNCDRANADADAFGDACDIMPNTPDPEAVIAALDTRLDTLEAAGTGAAITALQADVALLTAALVELRSKYPEHFHGLLGLNGDPVGDNGDLSYSLPGDP